MDNLGSDKNSLFRFLLLVSGFSLVSLEDSHGFVDLNKKENVRWFIAAKSSDFTLLLRELWSSNM